MNTEKSEYEFQHFHFTVEQMQLESRMFVKKCIKEMVKEFADTLLEKVNISDKSADAVREKTNDVAENIFKSYDNIFEKYDELVEKHFSIPENILLINDMRHEYEYKESDEEYYKEKIAEQEKTFTQNAYILTALQKELDMYECLDPIIERENQIADMLEKSFKEKLNLIEVNEMLRRTEEVLSKKENQSENNRESKLSI